jgi:hypothetical protein
VVPRPAIDDRQPGRAGWRAAGHAAELSHVGRKAPRSARLWPEPDWLKAVAGPALRLGPDRLAPGRVQPGRLVRRRKADAGGRQKWPEWFRLTEDRFAGKPFRLNTWQAVTVRLMVGWKIPTESSDEATGDAAPSSSASSAASCSGYRARTASRSSSPPWPCCSGPIDAVMRGQGFVFARKEEQAQDHLRQDEGDDRATRPSWPRARSSSRSRSS